jgi:glycosyltransferase involved in cell wall biosynthesis
MDDADALICVGQDEYDQARAHYPGKKVAYFPNGVRPELFAAGDGQAFRKAYGIRPEETLLLCVSRIDFQKNQLFLVRTFARFCTSHPDSRLVLIGSVSVDDYYRQLIQEIEALGLKEKVIIITGMSPDDPLLPGAYKACDCFVFPTLHEPFGIVILEAWAAQKPVIASATGGIPGFTTHGRDCLHFQPDNSDDLLDKLTQLVSNPELAAVIAANGYTNAITNYSWASVTGRLSDLYEELLHEHHRY